MSTSPARARDHIQKAVDGFVRLLQEELCLDFNRKKIPEMVEFLKQSLVVLNSSLPENEPSRLAVKIPFDPPRIEIRFISSRYTSEGCLAFIADHCPPEEAGQCLATIFFNPTPKTRH